MNVLILGSGGREHALALAVAKSPLLTSLLVAPGNPGIAEVAATVDIDLADHAAVVALARQRGIDFVIVGPEAPLVAGIVDDLAAAGIRAFGPTRAAAALEGSKAFAKDICRIAGAPTAEGASFASAPAAKAYIRSRGAPIVVKADGLAAGKGVIVAEDVRDAEKAVDRIMGGAFGAAGATVLIEECLIGEEASFFALCDGARAMPLGSAQDHKRALDGDRGPNTGGMGAYSPAPVMTPQIEALTMRRIVEPTLAAMAARGTPFRGVLFAGLMIGRDGPKLIEFNVRFGDPETQVLLPRLRGDLLALLLAAAEGRLPETPPPLARETALTVVMAAPGYPEAPRRGAAISGLAEAAALPGVVVTHAGTRREAGELIASGGRVLNVTGVGASAAEAQARAYAGVQAIRAPGLFFRRDIGWRAIGRRPGG